jgi:hypothetical protein
VQTMVYTHCNAMNAGSLLSTGALERRFATGPLPFDIVEKLLIRSPDAIFSAFFFEMRM